MNSQLIADAVGGSKGNDEAAIWDRLYAFWLRRLVYTQIWEDPVADLAALRLAVGSTIVTISSGGCSALSGTRSTSNLGESSQSDSIHTSLSATRDATSLPVPVTALPPQLVKGRETPVVAFKVGQITQVR